RAMAAKPRRRQGESSLATCGPSKTGGPFRGTVSIHFMSRASSSSGLLRGSEHLLDGEYHLREVDHLHVSAAGELLHPLEHCLLGLPGPVHDDALGPLDHLAIGEGLAQVLSFPVKGTELLIALQG